MQMPVSHAHTPAALLDVFSPSSEAGSSRFLLQRADSIYFGERERANVR